MPGANRRKGKRPLGGLGVPDEVAEGYGMLHASGGIPKELAEQRLGSAGLVRELTEGGLAHVVPPTPRTCAGTRSALLTTQEVFSTRSRTPPRRSSTAAIR
jgi:hypothetical protein